MLENTFHMDLVFNFFNRDEILVEKLMGRRVCPSCNQNYNVASINTPDGYKMAPLLPKKDHAKCDVCHNVKLVVRDDDKEHTIRSRLETYKQKTQPLLEYYQNPSKKTKVINFEAKKGIDDYPEIKEILKKELSL